MPNDRIGNTSYSRHFDLFQHYSSLLFKGRVSVVTVCILTWAYVLGIGKEAISGEVITFLGLHLDAKGFAALLAMFLLLSFMELELAYGRRLVEVVASGRLIEETYELKAFFSRYNTPTLGPMFQLYVANELGLAGIFISKISSHNIPIVTVASVGLSLLPILLILKRYSLKKMWQRTVGLDQDATVRQNPLSAAHQESVQTPDAPP